MRKLQVAPARALSAVNNVDGGALEVDAAKAKHAPLVRLPSRVATMELAYKLVQSHAWPGRLLWIGLVALHVMCGAFYAAVAYIYYALPSTLLAVNLKAFELTFDMRYFPVATALHAVFCAIHLALFVSMVVTSVSHRRLVFKPRRHPLRKNTRRWIHTWVWLWDAVFGPLGVFGVDNQNFEVFFALREFTETALQSYQAYQLSHYVPRVWLNNFWVVIIVINCWTTPVLRRIKRLSARRRIMLALLCDAVLDFVSSVGSPMVMAVPYLQDFDFATQDFNAEAWYSDLWFVNMINEFQLVFIQSWFDLLTRATFATSLLLCLDDVKILVSTVAPSERARNSIAERTPMGKALSDASRRTTTVTVLYRIMAVWGIALVGLHSAAMRSGTVPGCQLQVRPWATANTACSFLLVDCQAEGRVPVDGTESEMTASWQHTDYDKLTLVTIQNCPQLEIPASLQQLHRLVGLNIFDSTLVAWGSDAALTKATHPTFRHLGLLSVSFASFGNGNGSVLPPGLVSPDFPPTLFDIFVWNCGWSDLPADLDRVWPSRQNLLLPGNNFSTLPDVIVRMNPIRLMLDGNPLTMLSADVFRIVPLESIEVPSALLEALPELPSGLPSGSQLKRLNVAYTNVSVLPAWMTTPAFRAQVRVRAEGTPLCDNLAIAPPERVAMLNHVAC